MANRNRGYGGMDLDEGRFEVEPDRYESGRQYDDQERGPVQSEFGRPHYNSEYDRAYPGIGRSYGEHHVRGSSPYGESEWRERETARSYSQGPQRSHLRCRDIMTRDVVTCRRDTLIQEAARLMRGEDIGALPVIGEATKLEGIVTDRDIIVKALTSNKDDSELRVEDCMSDDVFTANKNDRVVKVIREMGDHQVRRIPVVDKNERLVGIISMADIARHTDKDIELAEALEEISKPSSWFARLTNFFSW